MAQTVKSVTTLELGTDEPFLIPVSLKKIASYKDVGFDNASPNGNALTQVKRDAVTGAEVANDDVRKGVFRSKPDSKDRATWGDFAEIPAEALDVIDEAAKIENFTVEHFISLKDVPFERVTEAYFLAPASGMSAKPLVLLARALKRTKRAGLFKLTKASRQYLAVVYEQHGGLIVNTLAWSDQFAAYREAAEALDRSDVKVRTEEVALASQLIEALAADADVIDTFEDDLVPLRADLVERALKGERLAPRAKKAAVQPPADDGLEARLRETLNQVPPPKRRAPVAAG